MKRGRMQTVMLWVMLSTTIFVGCTPMQPYYLHEDGDLSHYLDTATEIDFPDVEVCSLDEVTQSLEPLTIRSIDLDNLQTVDMTLEEAVSIALHNAKVIRTFGQVRQFGQFVGTPAERLSLGPDSVGTIYDVAIQESGQGGVEQVLSNFDAIFNSTATWESFDRLQNFNAGLIQTPLNQQDSVQINNEISKQSASGGQFFLRNTNTYFGANDAVTAGPRAVPSDWFTTIETEIRQPILRNRGTQVNRIPVVLARIRTDVSLTNFENQVANMLNEIERAYWDLVFFYHNLEAVKTGRDSALAIWRRVYAKFQTGAAGGEAEQEAQAREQYYAFRDRVERELTNLLEQEARLRYLLGWSPSDGRLIRPIDEPTKADVAFDYCTIRREALMRVPALRQQRWQIKRRELELIAARNQLLPRLDTVALYRWNGAGDEFNHDGPPVPEAPNFPRGALQNLLGGDFQEFRVGFEAEIPIGFRRELSQVRSQQLLLAREQARMEDMELEVLHQVDSSIKRLHAEYQAVETGMNRLAAATKQVESVLAAFDAGTVVLDLLLDAQRRRADAEAAYYQALTNYNHAIVTVHLRKGSILDYNSIVLAEGPWPQKAYFDAQNAARQRDASYAINYGFSRPDVISRGTVDNNLPMIADPVSYTGDPYPAEARSELPTEADKPQESDEGDSRKSDRQESPRLGPADGDERNEPIPPPPPLEEGYDFDDAGDDVPPLPELLEARLSRQSGSANRKPQRVAQRPSHRSRTSTGRSAAPRQTGASFSRPTTQQRQRVRLNNSNRSMQPNRTSSSRQPVQDATVKFAAAEETRSAKVEPPQMPKSNLGHESWNLSAPTSSVKQTSGSDLDVQSPIQLKFKD